MERPPISACIITFNEEKNIRDCLESIKWVEDIVIVDSLSQDNTVNICREYTNRVFQKEWPGHVKQKNCALDHAKNEWVLCLDADERISPELREEIESHLSKDDKEFDGYLFPRHSFYLGRWINHCGWYPDNKLRLFKKSKGRFSTSFIKICPTNYRLSIAFLLLLLKSWKAKAGNSVFLNFYFGHPLNSLGYM
jgi:glycosyltransferase involved in cell wall biosynthesis